MGVPEIGTKNWISQPSIHFKHKNSGLFVLQFSIEETQEYINIFHDTLRYKWLWLGKNYWYVYGYEFNHCVG